MSFARYSRRVEHDTGRSRLSDQSRLNWKVLAEVGGIWALEEFGCRKHGEKNERE